MDGNDMHHTGDEIKPGESLSTPEWWAATRAMDLTSRGGAQCTVALMYLNGLTEVPAEEVIMQGAKLTRGEAERAIAALEKVSPEVIALQLKHMRRWPAFMLEAMLP